jgi:co-chaperonin GroES (HSP10)
MKKAKIRDNSEVSYNPVDMPDKRLVIPLFDKVLISRDEAPHKQGVIWIPPIARDSQPVLSGRVSAVGPETKYTSPGDYVVFSQYAGSQVKVDGITYVAMREQDVHIIIR